MIHPFFPSMLLLFFFFCGNVLPIFAQTNPPPCGNDFVERRLENKNKNYTEELAAYYESVRTMAQPHASTSRSVATIPVVVHVIHKGTSVGVAHNISESLIHNQIAILNADYRRTNSDADETPPLFEDNAVDTRIEFRLANTAPNGSPTNGIIRHQYSSVPTTDYIDNVIKPQTQWNPHRYLNIWCVPTIENQSHILGYSYLPTGTILGTPKDGVVIVYDRFGTQGSISKGRTVTHEVGHYLGLPHIFGNGSGGCSTDDGIQDTPNAGQAYYGCPSFPQNSCGSPDMYMNYMDYVDDRCMNMFTFGQSNVMNSILSTVRNEMIDNASLVVATQSASSLPNIRIAPNPASDVLQISFEDARQAQSADIQLFSAGGQGVNLLGMSKSTVSQTYSVAHLPSGVYFLVITISDVSHTHKVIVQ